MPNRPSRLSSFCVWVPVVAWMGFIFFSSSIPGRDVPALFAHQDVVSHIAVYGILGWLFARALGRGRASSFQMVAVTTVVFCLVYGISDEFHQSFVPGREVSLLDVVSDGIGGLIGALTARRSK